MIVTAVKPGLRGELSRWLLEPHAGEKVEREAGDGSGVLLFSARNEQGFMVRAFGDRRRFPADFEGLTLIQQFPDR
jgi:CRISPR-associated protein Cas2